MYNSPMLGERPLDFHVSTKPPHTGVSEIEAHRLFRTVNPEEIALLYKEVIKDHAIQESKIARSIDPIGLDSIIWGLDPNLVIAQFRTLFEQIACVQDIESAAEVKYRYWATIYNTKKVLSALINLTSVPKRNWKQLYIPKDLSFRTDLPYLINEDLPIDQKLDEVIKALTLDHDTALQLVKPGLTLEEIKALQQEEYIDACRNAGQMMAGKTYYGLLTDAQNKGKNNVLRFQKQRSSEQLTDFGLCPAVSFVHRYCQGLGIALAQSKEQVLTIIS